MKEIHQLHVNVKASTYRELRQLLPEQRMVSLLVRKLISSYIEEVKGGANPWGFLHLNKIKNGASNGTN